jgi:hypothetical protein
MLGYFSTIRLVRTGASHHVECGSLLPLSAAGACPDVLLAPTYERQSPIGALAFLRRRHPERSFARFCFSRGLCGRETQSKDLSSISIAPRREQTVRLCFFRGGPRFRL